MCLSPGTENGRRGVAPAVGRPTVGGQRVQRREVADSLGADLVMVGDGPIPAVGQGYIPVRIPFHVPIMNAQSVQIHLNFTCGLLFCGRSHSRDRRRSYRSRSHSRERR